MKVNLKGNVVTLTFELGEGVPSSSGKSLVLASTRGNKSLGDLSGGKAGEYSDVMVGLNVYKRA